MLLLNPVLFNYKINVVFKVVLALIWLLEIEEKKFGFSSLLI